jgi:hypothetical protein
VGDQNRNLTIGLFYEKKCNDKKAEKSEKTERTENNQYNEEAEKKTKTENRKI